MGRDQVLGLDADLVEQREPPRRSRRQDEIGTPYCITIDFDTLGETESLKDTVTLRDRDTGEQERVAIAELVGRLR